jgi:uncharacterized protein
MNPENQKLNWKNLQHRMKKGSRGFCAIGLWCFFLIAPVFLSAQDKVAFSEEEVRWPSSDDGIFLSGILSIPKKKAPWPAVLLVNSQAFSDADQANSGNPVYRDLARGLAEAGFAVLRVHSRCWTDASILPSEVTMGVLFEDVLSSAQWLRNCKGVNLSNYGVIAYQENMLAALALCNNGFPIQYVIGMQPMANSPLEHVCEQTARVLANTSLPDSTQIKYLDLLYILLRTIKVEADEDRTRRQLNDVIENHMAHFEDWEIEELALSRNDRGYLMSYLQSVHMKSFISLPLKSEYQACSLPVLVLSGKPADTAGFRYRQDLLEKICREKKDLNWKYVFLEDHDHYFKAVHSGAGQTDRREDAVFSQKLRSEILQFIQSINE